MLADQQAARNEAEQSRRKANAEIAQQRERAREEVREHVIGGATRALDAALLALRDGAARAADVRAALRALMKATQATGAGRSLPRPRRAHAQLRRKREADREAHRAEAATRREQRRQRRPRERAARRRGGNRRPAPRPEGAAAPRGPAPPAPAEPPEPAESAGDALPAAAVKAARRRDNVVCKVCREPAVPRRGAACATR